MRTTFPERTPTCRKVLAALRIAATIALAVPTASQAAEAKLVFGTGLSIDGITFTPHAFNMTWNGFGALGRPDLDAASLLLPSGKNIAAGVTKVCHTLTE